MFRFIRRLFGNDVTTADSRGDDDTELVVHRSSRAHKPCVSDTYFDTMSRMQAAVSNRDYEGAARLVCENLQYIPDWVKETRRDYGSFDIGSFQLSSRAERCLPSSAMKRDSLGCTKPSCLCRRSSRGPMRSSGTSTTVGCSRPSSRWSLLSRTAYRRRSRD